MKILLDTHVWIWYLLKDKRLRRAHRSLMEDPSNELLLSSITIWEAHLLIERGRLAVSQTPKEWISLALQNLPVREAEITFAIAMRSRNIGMEHGDPADRFLAATAIELKIPLLTCDPLIFACNEVRFL